MQLYYIEFISSFKYFDFAVAVTTKIKIEVSVDFFFLHTWCNECNYHIDIILRLLNLVKIYQILPSSVVPGVLYWRFHQQIIFLFIFSFFFFFFGNCLKWCKFLATILTLSH